MSIRKIRPIWVIVGLALFGAAAWYGVLAIHARYNTADAADYFRITGEVEIEGKRISYDELIQVRMETRTNSLLGLQKGDNRIVFSRRWIIRELQGGGALVMEVPQAAGLFEDLENPNGNSGTTTSTTLADGYSRPPKIYLPEFSWFDNAAKPTVIEIYISEAFYASAARLKITQPFRISFIASNDEVEAEAIRQANSEPELGPFGDSQVAWKAITGVEIPSSVLASLPSELRGPLRELQARGQSNIPQPLTQSLWDYSRLSMGVLPSFRSNGHGVPQPKLYPDDKGVLYRQAPGPTADGAIPADCSIAAKVCSFLVSQRGYLIFRQMKLNDGDWRISIEGRLFELKFGEGLLDPESGSVWLLGVSAL